MQNDGRPPLTRPCGVRVTYFRTGTQFFCPFRRPARRSRRRLRRGRPARDQYESGCPGSAYPDGLVVFSLQLTNAALVF